MKKIFVLKSLSALALLCLLASHCELYSQSNDTLARVSKSDLTIRLQYINNGSIELNQELFKLNGTGKINENDIERLSKIQTFLVYRLTFIETFCNDFLITDPETMQNIKTVKNNVDVSGKNLETLTNNFYYKGLSDILIQELYKILINQFPGLEYALNLIMKLK